MKATFFLRALAIVFLCSAAFLANAQQDVATAEYPGGLEALMKYMTSSIKYPEAAQKEKAEGLVYVKFVVDKNGSITNVRTANEGALIRPDLALEAIRVVKGMPKWRPAQKDGKAVSCEMTLPVKFKL